MMKEQSYSEQYYELMSPGSSKSAGFVVPVICSFIQPKSVVDVGCGIGTWLKVWQQHGINDYMGIDGNYVLKHLIIPHENFLAVNLEERVQLDRKFDLVMSLEVAEHLRPYHAAGFIALLCTLGDVIVFSAAIPGQGGTSHFNEQYPQYWANLFAENGFTGYDCIRSKIWTNDEIDGCYKQNTFFFVRDTVKEKYPAITSHIGPLLPLVHPQIFLTKENVLKSYKKIVSTPLHAAWHFVKSFFRLFKKDNSFNNL